MLCRFCESQTAEIFLLNLLVAQLNGAYGAVYDDTVGYARLTRGSIIATRLNRWGWQFEWGIWGSNWLNMFAASPRFARGQSRISFGFKLFTFQNNKHQNPKT